MLKLTLPKDFTGRLKGKLVSDFKLIREHRNRVTYLMNVARKRTHRLISDHCDNQEKLFRAGNKLPSPKNELCFPNCSDNTVLSNDIGAFSCRRSLKFAMQWLGTLLALILKNVKWYLRINDYWQTVVWLKRTVPWIPCLRLWLLIVRRIATNDYPSHKFLPDYRLLPQCLEESTDHAALTEKRGLSLCSATCARLATFTSFLS